jgi:thioesterase domain-containing protein/acyl carrier protein
VREDTPGDRRLVAYVVPESHMTLEAAALRDYAKTRLPEYMLPSVVVVESLPLTANGKVDRRALPAPNPAPHYVSVSPARTELQKTLVRIWEKHLKVPVGIDSSFFDLGGHSLLLVSVLAEIERTTGERLPLATVFQNPTVAHLAEQIEKRRAQNTAPLLVSWNATGFRPPLFIGGSNPKYLEVARLLGPDQPVYKMDLFGLQEWRHCAGLPVDRDFESMAADFVPAIRAIQPEGPYYLGGGCDGGILALAVARQLEAQGEKIGLLIQWETPISGYFQRNWPRTFRYYLGNGASLIASGRARRSLKAKLNRPDPDEMEPGDRQYFELWRSIWKAISAYTRKESLRAPIAFLRAREHVPYYQDVSTGWRLMGTDFKLYEIPGNHSNYFTTYIRDFAAAIDTALTDFRPVRQARTSL